MEVANEHKEQLKVCQLPKFHPLSKRDAKLALFRDERRKQISSNKAACLQSNFLQCRKRRSEMLHRDMVDALLFPPKVSSILMICLRCMDSLGGWRWSWSGSLHWMGGSHATVLQLIDKLHRISSLKIFRIK